MWTIASSYQLFLQDDINVPVSTNVVTRGGVVVKVPLGPPEYEAEKDRKENPYSKQAKKMIQWWILKMNLLKKHKTKPCRSKMMHKMTAMALIQRLLIQDKKIRYEMKTKLL